MPYKAAFVIHYFFALSSCIWSRIGTHYKTNIFPLFSSCIWSRIGTHYKTNIFPNKECCHAFFCQGKNYKDNKYFYFIKQLLCKNFKILYYII